MSSVASVFWHSLSGSPDRMSKVTSTPKLAYYTADWEVRIFTKKYVQILGNINSKCLCNFKIHFWLSYSTEINTNFK